MRNRNIYILRIFSVIFAFMWIGSANAMFIVDSTNGLVTDTSTGLMWDQCPLGLSGATCTTGTANSDNWNTADVTDVTNANIANYKTHNDWFLPSDSQMGSLNTLGGSPTIDTTYFPMADTTTAFWTSTVNSPGFAYFITYFNGNSGVQNENSTSRVRLARNAVVLSLSQTGPTPTLQVGVNSTYTLTVTNNGLSNATVAQVSDIIPTGFNFISATGTNWSCSNSSGTISCTFSGGTISASGGTSTINVIVSPPSSAVNTSVTNYGSVGASGGTPPTAGSSCSPSISCSASVAGTVAAAVLGQVSGIPSLSEKSLLILATLLGLLAIRANSSREQS